MSQIRLSICVVTYNDAQELCETLSGLERDSGLWSQSAEGSLELVISDNASLDSTQEILGNFETALPGPLRRFRQKMNLGFRGNLEFCVSESRGEWVMFLGAGDQLETKNLARLIEFLGESCAQVVYFNSSSLDLATGKHEVSEYDASSKPLFSRAPIPIFRSATLASIIRGKRPISGDSWPQVEWALDCSREGPGSIAVFSGTLISSRRPLSGWWSRSDAFLVPMSISRVFRHITDEGHWAESQLKKLTDFPWLQPALWVYQSRFAHGSKRPSLTQILKFWNYSPITLKAGLSWVLLLAVSLLTRGMLRMLGAFVRNVSAR